MTLVDNSGNIDLRSTQPTSCTFSPTDTTQFIAAITTANGTPEPDTICLASGGTYTFTAASSGGNALPTITSEIIIEGNNATLSRDGAAPNFRFFEVNSLGNLTLNSVTLTNGDGNFPTGGGSSGGISNVLGTVTLNDSTFTSNSGVTGGAVDNVGGTVTLSENGFTSNTGFTGGAIDNRGGSNTSDNRTFTDNVATWSGGAFYNVGGLVNMTQNTFTGNIADTGGGVDNRGSSMTISASTFAQNSATNGGAAYNDGGVLTLMDNTLTSNSAITNGGSVYSAAASASVANNNCIAGNTGPTSVYKPAAPSADFTQNWWGNASGPSGSGPGTGDSVSANISFTPWLISDLCQP